MKFSIFKLKKNLCILYGQVFVGRNSIIEIGTTIQHFYGFHYTTCTSKHAIKGFIRKTCPCKEYPLKPHFYIVKLGFAGVYLFFLFLLQNIDCGYSLEPLGEAVLTCTHNLCFEQKQEKYQKFSDEIFNFYNFKNLCILHGQVFIMFGTLVYFFKIK